MENRAHALAAGLFVVVLFLGMAAAAWWLSGQRENTSQYLLVARHSVSGLNPQAQVRYRGIRAGKVEEITLDPADARNILVLISIDAAIPITTGTTARLNSQGITGLSYVQLDDDGSRAAPLVGKGGEPPRIALLPSAFDSLSDRAAQAVERVGALAARLDALLDERGIAQLKRTLDNVALASEGLRDLPRITAGMREVLSEDNLRHLQRILVHLERTAGETAPLTSELRGLVASFRDLSARLDQIAGDVGGATLPQVNSLLLELQQNSRQLNRVLEGFDELPQTILFGRTPARPGPGEAGYAHPRAAPGTP